MLPAAINLGLADQALGNWSSAARRLREVAATNPAFLVDKWDGRNEVDCFRSLYTTRRCSATPGFGTTLPTANATKET